MKISDEYKRKARQANLLSYFMEQNEIAQREGKGIVYEIAKEGSQYRLVGHQGLLFKDNYWNQRSTGQGGNSIDFLQKIEGLSFRDAVKQLTDFVDRNPVSAIEHQFTERLKPKVDFVLPEKHTDYRRAIAYLNKTRGIDHDILLPEFKKGFIYEEKEYHNVVFVGRDEHDEPKWAQKRSTLTNRKFINDHEGSDARFTFRLGNPAAKTVVVVESPIEALSLKNLLVMNNKDVSNFCFLPLGGVHDTALEHHLKMNPSCRGVLTALNNDYGEKPNQIKGREGSKIIVDKYRAKGYSANSIFPVGNDWNDDLVALRKPKQVAPVLTEQQKIEQQIKDYAKQKKSRQLIHEREHIR